jgi:methanogenic corrinoid protein MtbC1
MAAQLVELAEMIGRLESAEKTTILLSSLLSQELPASEIAEKAIRPGMTIVGKRYESGEYFLAELLYAGSLVTDLLKILEPAMKNQRITPKGVIVLGTVRGDIHDIGKNIFKTLAEGAGFEVHDLGVDVDPASFIDEATKSKPTIVALSALLTTSLMEMKTTVHSLMIRAAENNPKIILGGNAVTKEFADEIGADAAALDAVQGIDLCKLWTNK